MEIKYYLSPVKPETLTFPNVPVSESLKSQTTFFAGEDNFLLESFSLAVIGVEEDRNSPYNMGSALAPNKIRPFLYSLKSIEPALKIVDLGNILGNSVNDKYCALEELLSYLNANNIVVIVLGGSNDFFNVQIKSLQANSSASRVKCSVVDALIDADGNNDGLTSINYLSDLLNPSNFKSDITIAGAQKYYMSKFQENFVALNFIDLIRLKDLRGDDVRNIEAPFRDSEAIGFDVSAISSPSLPAFYAPRPNGLSSLDACQIGWYAGYSTEIKSFGIYELNPKFDINNLSSALAGQIVWHFILGFSNKRKHFTLKDVNSLRKFNVLLESYAVSINFYNDENDVRWWMEVVDNGEVLIVSCNKSDYYDALQGQMPKKWWRYFQRSQHA